MISIMDLDAEDLKGMALAMSNCGSTVTRDLGAVEDGTAGMLRGSPGIMVGPDKQG